MGARAEALAKEYEAKAAEVTAVLERLSDADWKKVTAGEKWTVGVVAHHIAGAHEAIAGLLKAVAGGQKSTSLTLDMLHDMNAKHAQDFANCTRAETLALHRRGVAAAAGAVRALSDAELDQTGAVLSGAPPMSTQQAIQGILINHMNDHLASIRTTAGV